MSTIKLAKIGAKAFNGIGTDIRFLSNDYLLEYDVIIVSASAILEEFSEDPDQFDREEFMDFFDKRQADLKEFYKYGGRLILLIDENPVYNDLEGVEEFQEGKLINILSTCRPRIEYVLQTGSNVICADVITPFTNTVSIDFKALLNHRVNKPLITTQRSKQRLSYHQKVADGFFMALPAIYVHEAHNTEMIKETFKQLINICNRLQQKRGKQIA